MATLTLSVPDELLRRAKARFGKKTKADLQDRLVQCLKAMATDGEPIDAATESKLLEGLDSPLESMTPADWKSLHARVERHRKRANA